MEDINILVSEENYFPQRKIDEEIDSTLQSMIFGHRFKGDQTVYEYLLEFLQVVISKKNINTQEPCMDYFPTDISIEEVTDIAYYPISRIGLKRFIFFDRSKLDTRYEVDYHAHDNCIEAIRQNLCINTHKDYVDDEFCIKMIKNTLYGYNAVLKNRSWFAQSLLPICPEVILPESMGERTKRKNLKYEQESSLVDNGFEYNNYNFMARGGEVYYLHVLAALINNPMVKADIVSGIQNLIGKYPQASELCKFIDETWMTTLGSERAPVKKRIGFATRYNTIRENCTLSELRNLLHTDIHAFEKMEILAHGMVLQIIRLIHDQASTISKRDCNYRSTWIVDFTARDEANKEMRKLAIKSFNDGEEQIIDAIHLMYEALDYKNSGIAKKKSEISIKNDAVGDSVKLCRKLGKEIGLIVPLKGTGMRFSFSEVIIKFLVLSLIPPKTKITLERFIEKLYIHYGVVLERKHAKLYFESEIEGGSMALDFMELNKRSFIQRLKDCGFLRDLSDATSIVENPYAKVGE